MCSRARIMTRTHVEGIICSRDKRVPWVIHVESWLDDRKWSLTLNGSTTSILVKTSGNWLSVRAHRFCAIVCVSESSTIVFAIRNYHIANALSRVNSRSREISFDNVMKKLVTVLSTGLKTLNENEDFESRGRIVNYGRIKLKWKTWEINVEAFTALNTSCLYTVFIRRVIHQGKCRLTFIVREIS